MVKRIYANGGLHYANWTVIRQENGIGFGCYCGGWWCDSYVDFEAAYRWFYCRASQYGFNGRKPKGWQNNENAKEVA